MAETRGYCTVEPAALLSNRATTRLPGFMFEQSLLATDKPVPSSIARAFILVGLLLLFFLALFVFWGVARSGFWNDDPRNWQRAFGEDTPKGVSVVHSQYWRTAHFSYEAGWYFELKVSPERRRKLVQSNLVPVEILESTKMDEPCPDPPRWFVPKPLLSYQVWRSDGRYRLFVDRATSEAFVSDCQY